ncbi:AGAP009947-PA-like protein [Anopheles sinensis]|uniref:AGAP009947-PA-like protein n=1 Tax=Anopheles sinensis TaxID=74873 RepID=A0A084WG15_ANOSI|nr:AGAP009947-PA-like protein [Anopheles sinensis]
MHYFSAKLQIIQQYIKQYRPIKDTHTGLDTSILGINILVAHSHFVKGKLKQRFTLLVAHSIHPVISSNRQQLSLTDRRSLKKLKRKKKVKSVINI